MVVGRLGQNRVQGLRVVKAWFRNGSSGYLVKLPSAGIRVLSAQDAVQRRQQRLPRVDKSQIGGGLHLAPSQHEAGVMRCIVHRGQRTCGGDAARNGPWVDGCISCMQASAQCACALVMVRSHGAKASSLAMNSVLCTVYSAVSCTHA
jgi:hypothetical protein